MFLLFMMMMISQRLLEVWIAKRNERWMKQQGGIEYGRSHYPYIVMIHALFFTVYMLEVLLFDKEINPNWPVLLLFFIIIQVGRIWSLLSLGKFWNTKIIVLPDVYIQKKGPYRFVRHPNYLVVTMEFLIIPLMFQAYVTTIVFSLLNLMILSIRIPVEERALGEQTGYEGGLASRNRVVRTFMKKL